MDSIGGLKAGDKGDATAVAESFEEQNRFLSDVICQNIGYGKMYCRSWNEIRLLVQFKMV